MSSEELDDFFEIFEKDMEKCKSCNDKTCPFFKSKENINSLEGDKNAEI